MKRKPGAIVLTISYILQACQCLKMPFDSEFIFEQYPKMLKDQQHRKNIMAISNKYKKHHRNNEFSTFQSASRLRGWLRKHCGKKPETWFNEKDGKFLFIKIPDLDERENG